MRHTPTAESSQTCNLLAKEIWEWCIDRAMWISVVHIHVIKGSLSGNMIVNPYHML